MVIRFEICADSYRVCSADSWTCDNGDSSVCLIERVSKCSDVIRIYRMMGETENVE